LPAGRREKDLKGRGGRGSPGEKQTRERTRKGGFKKKVKGLTRWEIPLQEKKNAHSLKGGKNVFCPHREGEKGGGSRQNQPAQKGRRPEETNNPPGGGESDSLSRVIVGGKGF